MKALVFLFVMLPLVTSAQQSFINVPLEGDTVCGEFVMMQIDKIKGDTGFVNSQEITIKSNVKGSINIVFYTTKKENAVIAGFTVDDSGPCVDEGSEINLLFRDGSRMTIRSSGGFNCKGRLSFWPLKIKLKAGGKYEALATKEIEMMRCQTRSGFVDVQLIEEQSRRIMRTFACLADI